MGANENNNGHNKQSKKRNTVSGKNRVGTVVDYNTFVERLDNATGKAKLAEIDRALDLVDGTSSKIRNGKIDLTVDYLFQIAQKYNCSIDYLLGLSDDNNISSRSNINTNTADRFINIIQSKNQEQPLIDNHIPTVKHVLLWINKLVEIGAIDVVALNGDALPVPPATIPRALNDSETSEFSNRFLFMNNQIKEYAHIALVPFNHDCMYGNERSMPLVDALIQYASIRKLVDSGTLTADILNSWINGYSNGEYYSGFYEDESCYETDDGVILEWDKKQHSYCDKSGNRYAFDSKSNDYIIQDSDNDIEDELPFKTD